MERQDFDTCKSIADLIELASRKAADFGSEFAGRNWLMDGEEDAKVAEICKDTVAKLREAYRTLSEAESIMEGRAHLATPEKVSLVRRVLFLGSGD
jgi:hypothetical protein